MHFKVVKCRDLNFVGEASTFYHLTGNGIASEKVLSIRIAKVIATRYLLNDMLQILNVMKYFNIWLQSANMSVKFNREITIENTVVKVIHILASFRETGIICDCGRI